MPGFVLLDIFLDLSDEHPVIFFQTNRRRLDDEGFGEFASSIVRDGNDSGIANRRVCQKMSFKLSRRNL